MEPEGLTDPDDLTEPEMALLDEALPLVPETDRDAVPEGVPDGETERDPLEAEVPCEIDPVPDDRGDALPWLLDLEEETPVGFAAELEETMAVPDDEECDGEPDTGFECEDDPDAEAWRVELE